MIILLGVSILGAGYLYQNRNRQIQQSMLEDKRQYLTILSNNIKYQIDTANNVAFFLINAPDIIALSLHKNIVEHGWNSVDIIRNFVVASEAEEIYFYVNNIEYIFTSDGIYPSQSVNTSISVNDKFMSQYINGIEKNIKLENVVVTSPNNVKKDVLLYTISYFDKFQMCVALNNIISNYTDINNDEIILLVDSTNNVIAKSSEEFEYEANFDPNKSQVLEYNNINYKVLDEDVNEHYKLILLTPEKKYVKINALYVLVAGAVLLLLLFVAYIAALYSYQPVKKLYRNIVTKKGEEKNEILAISNTVKSVRDENEAIKHNILINREAIKNGILQSIINGKYSELKDLNKVSVIANISFFENAYYILYIYTNYKAVQFIEELKQFQENYQDNVQLFGAHIFGEKGLVYFFTMDDTKKADLFHEYFYNEVIGRIDSNAKMGISSLQKDLKYAGQAFSEAKTAIYYSEESKIKNFTEIPFMTESIKEIYEPEFIIRKIQKYINKGDTYSLKQSLLDLKKHIYINKMSIHSIRIIINRIKNICYYSYALHIDSLKGDLAFDIKILLEKENTIDIVLECFVELCEKIHTSMEMKQYINNHVLIEDIKEFINNECINSSLTVQQIATSFNMSQAKLVHLFQQIQGKSTISYIKEIRLEKAKELLSETDDKITDIVKKIGYLSVPSFINNFKKYTGHSPKMFRTDSVEICNLFDDNN